MNNRFRPEIKSLHILHTALLAGQIIVLLLSLLLAGKHTAVESITFFKILQGVVAVTAIVSVTAGFVVFAKNVSRLQQSGLSFPEKFRDYRAASILKFALIEGPVLFSIVAYFIYPNLSFIVLAVILLVIFVLQRPTIPMLVLHLQADRENFFE
jgi:MFS family permease